MKPSTRIRFFFLIAALSATVGAVLAWQHPHLLSATPDTESAFLKDYVPQVVIDRFVCHESLSQAGPSLTAAAGEDFVTHQSTVEWYFAMRLDNAVPLMSALNHDLEARLTLNRAQILSRRGDAESGFHYNYKIGKSVGILTIAPVELSSGVHRAKPLPTGVVDVVAKVDVVEKWYPKEEAATQASLVIRP